MNTSGIRKQFRKLLESNEFVEGDDGVYYMFPAASFDHFHHKVGEYAGECDCFDCEDKVERVEEEGNG